MSTLSLRLSDALLARLEAASRRRRVPKAALVRAALERELTGPEESSRTALTFSSHRLGNEAGGTWSRSELYGDDGR